MPDPLDSLRGAIRSAIGAAEHVEREVQERNPVLLEQRLDAKLDETLAAVHRACAAGERHVEVLEGVAESLGPLTESVARLTDQLNVLMQVLAPVAAVERDAARVERDVSRVERIFHRHRHEIAPDGEGSQVPPTTSSGFHPEPPPPGDR